MEQKPQITETEWGINVVIQDGFVIDNTNILPASESILLRCKEIGKKKILVDASTTQRKASFIKLFELGEMMQKLEVAQFKIAFVAPNFADDENSKFMEDLGVNRGISLKYFKDKESAKDWLMKLVF